MTETHKKILIVEDDGFLAKVYQYNFKKSDFETFVAGNAEDALSFLKKEIPSVIVLDLMLPGLSGFSVLEEMNKNEKWSTIPVIIHTNLGQSDDVERGKKLGAKEYIIKGQMRLEDVIQKVISYAT